MWAWQVYVCRGCGAKLRQTLRHRLVVCLPLALIGTTIQIVGAQSQSPPLVIAGAAVTGIALAVMLYFDRVRVVSPGPFCTNCEYDLTAVPEGVVCPECGAHRNTPHYSSRATQSEHLPVRYSIDTRLFLAEQSDRT